MQYFQSRKGDVVSLPRASDIAARAGVTASVVSAKSPKIDKKAEEARLRTLQGDDEEGDRGPQAGAGGAGKSGGAAATKFGQDERQKVKRKRVKLSELTSKKTGEAKPKAETAAQAEAKEAKAAKTTPEEIGRKVAQQKLNEQGKLAETRYLYQQKLSQSNQDPNNALSPQARQKRMLNSLISYQQNNYMQHTGDKAGEIYNRPATRQILQALQGLKSGAPTQTAENKSSGSTSTGTTSPAAFKAKSEQANKMLEIFMREDTQPPPGYEPTELVA
jgi:hypothetical protein